MANTGNVRYDDIRSGDVYVCASSSTKYLLLFTTTNKPERGTSDGLVCTYLHDGRSGASPQFTEHRLEMVWRLVKNNKLIFVGNIEKELEQFYINVMNNIDINIV